MLSLKFFKSKKAGGQPFVVASLLAVGRINLINTESGYTEHDVMQRLAGSAFSGFVAKPYSLTNLQSVLQTVLQRATALDPADTLS